MKQSVTITKTTVQTINLTEEDLEMYVKEKLNLTGKVDFKWNRGQLVSLTVTKSYTEDITNKSNLL